MLKRIRKKVKNQGNTFIMVVVTLSFLAILTAAILVAIALCYRLKIMDINSRDNFYYLEQAMDEIYAGVGKDSIDKLNSAYTDTLEVIVYYDTDSKSYVTMNNDAANKLMKTTYMRMIREESAYRNPDEAVERIRSFVTNAYDKDTNPEGILINQTLDADGNAVDDGKLQVDISTKVKNDNVTILNLKLSRTAKYSTLTIGKKGASDSFTQSVSTDVVIGEPQFDVSFDMINASLNNLFSFSMLADKGIEIKDATVNVTGDIYAAADFYNKDYNGPEFNSSSENVTNVSVQDSVVDPILNSNAIQGDAEAKKKVAAMYTVPVSSYGTKTSSGNTMFSGNRGQRFSNQNGTDEKSMYSGLYMSNSNVTLTSNKVVVPGTIAAMNLSKLTVSAISGNMVGKTDIWADNITLGGYSAYLGKDTMSGSSMTLNANCYISDDLEVNANSSDFTLIGEYYGYNNATTDTRSFSTAFLKKNGIYTLTADTDNNTVAANGKLKRAYQTGQEHYNSSSVIINGENASLDLKDVSAMYIAGQSYIELRKDNTKSHTETITYKGNEGDEDEDVTVQDYSYISPDTSTDQSGNNTYYSDGTRAEGDVVREENGTTETTTGGAVQDYKTGEAVSIKSNQLAYGNIPSANIKEKKDAQGNVVGYYVTLDTAVLKEDAFKKAWKDGSLEKAISEIPVIKTVISGKRYYYFDFTSADTTNKNVNEFIASYAEIFAKNSTSAAKSFLTDITDYEEFEVNMLKLPTKQNSNETDYSKIYSNSALTAKYGSTFSITADSDSGKALLQAATRINDNEEAKGKEGSGNSGKIGDVENKAAINDNSAAASAKRAALSQEVTRGMQEQYKEMKLLLSTQSSDSEGVALAHIIKDSAITPINYYFKFSSFDKYSSDLADKKDEDFAGSGYGIWLSDEDIKIEKQKGSGNVKGIVIAKGDVTFDQNVNSFEGIIISGSKIIVDHSVDFVANEEIVKSILRICEDKRANGNIYDHILSLFRSYGGDESTNDTKVDKNYETTRTISTIQFEDIVEFNNWKKNVE